MALPPTPPGQPEKPERPARPDDLPGSSSSITRATDLLYEAATGAKPPTGASARYDRFREAVAAVVNATAVRVLNEYLAHTSGKKL